MEVSANDIVAEVCCCDTARLTGPVCSEYFERGDVSPFRINPLLYLEQKTDFRFSFSFISRNRFIGRCRSIPEATNSVHGSS